MTCTSELAITKMYKPTFKNVFNMWEDESKFIKVSNEKNIGNSYLKLRRDI